MGKSKRKRPDHSQRGGLGVRKKLSEASRVGVAANRLSGVQKYATVAECLDKYGRWELGNRLGTIVRMTSSWVWIVWDGDDDVSAYQQGDAFYKVFRGLWRLSNPRRSSPLDPRGGPPIPEEFKPPKSSLTGDAGNDRVAYRRNRDEDDEPTTEEQQMPKEMSNAAAERKAAKDNKDNLPERDVYSAKQVATRCGTDAKTMRKFFRSSASTVEPVGQGGRYNFDAADLPKIKREFATWRKKANARGGPIKKLNPSTPPPEDMVIAEAQNRLSEGEDENENAEFLAESLMNIDEDEEPSKEELSEIDDLDLDDLDEEE